MMKTLLAARPLVLAFHVLVALPVPGVAQTPNPNAPIAIPADLPIRVACVGDSITFGWPLKNPATESYPAQLQRMLGSAAWEVRNFGVSGATLLNRGDRPYQQQPAFAAALAFEPNVVIIMLGTNDTKPENWRFKSGFESDYKSFVAKFQALSSRPRVFVCRPVIIPNGGKYGINEPVLQEEMPIIAAVAKDKGAGLIDLHGALEGRESLLPDNVHPNVEGANRLARTVYRALTGSEFSGDSKP